MTPSIPAHPKLSLQSANRYRPGQLIHEKYQLIRRLGQGGMGTVWVARNTVLEVSVAIKLIALEGPTTGTKADIEETAERLLREARAAARLDHPAIVRVFDFGRTSYGDPFIVMELLHGESLADVLNREVRVTAMQAVRIMLPIAEALASAHDKGVVHRDVKPENVILATTEDGRTQPKLLDFGIASLQEQNTRITQEKRLTREGSVVGTPAYMSPEQAMGKDDLDQRTDVWSFGVMLYELTTGRLPFDADNYNALLYEIIHQAPEPCTMHAAGDEELWQILEVALRKRPEERWGSMRAFGEALALWLVDRGVREDICAASLRSAWLDSKAPLEAKVDLAATIPESQAGPPVELPMVPLPAKPPARTLRTSGTRIKRARWPLMATFLAACFLAGLFGVNYWLSSQSSESEARAQTNDQAPVKTKGTTAFTRIEVGQPRETVDRDDSEHSQPNQRAPLPLDEALGEAEAAPRKKPRSSKISASKATRAAPARKSRTPKPAADAPIDFGF